MTRTVLCPATILAEIGDSRERYPTYRQLAADAGQAPVAVESGKSKRAHFRWACDHRLRVAIDTLADSSRHHNPWAKDIYTRARARGCTHQHATRILGRAWCQIIWRLWHDHDTYNPNKHTARQRLLATTGAEEHHPTHPRMKIGARRPPPQPPDNRSTHPADLTTTQRRPAPPSPQAAPGQNAQRLTASRPTLPTPSRLTQGASERGVRLQTWSAG